MLTKKLSEKVALSLTRLRCFGGGHHVTAYDWRDDLERNPDLNDEDPK